jgi:FAD/FMN-containing dehydrogenase
MTGAATAYNAFGKDAALEAGFPAEALKFDEIYRAVYGRDGSYFEYLPQAVVRVASAADVQSLLRIGTAQNVPITLRAGGSSLSGQYRGCWFPAWSSSGHISKSSASAT